MKGVDSHQSVLSFWAVIISILLGMAGGAVGTLWVVRRFGVAVGLIPATTVSPVAGEANRGKAPQSEMGASTSGIKPQAVAVASQISSDGQFRFDLQSCRRAEKGVLCELQITNLTGKEIDFVLNGGNEPQTLAYTDNGLQYQATNLVLGSQANSYYAQQTLVSQIPTPASLTFREMPLTPQLSLLKIGYRHRSLETARWLDGSLEFRPVPLIQ